MVLIFTMKFYKKTYPLCRIRINFDFSFRKFILYLQNTKLIEERYIKKFELEFSRYIGIKYAIAVPSARYGLYLILKALKINKDEEIIISAYNSPIIPNVIQDYGAKIIYVDADKNTMNIDITKVKKVITEKTRAIILTHIEGNSVDINRIRRIAKKYNIYMVEDCAHACGSKYCNKKVGSFGIASLFSFGLGKQINTLGGGMVCTNNEEIAMLIKKDLNSLKNLERRKLVIRFIKAKIISFVQKPIPFSVLIYLPLLLCSNHDPITWLFGDTGKISDININRKYSNLQALLGLEQLRNLDFYNKKISKNVAFIKNNLKLIKFQEILPCAQPAYLSLTIRAKQIEKLRKNLLKQGIDTQRTWMRNCSNSKDKFPISQGLQDSCLYLPIYPQLRKKDLKKIIIGTTKCIKK